MRKKRLTRVASFVLAMMLVLTGTLLYSANLSKVEAADYIPVYRLYNPNTGEHFYTVNEVEYEKLQKIGWNDEGIGWYGASSGEAVYRLYNPNAIGGDHYYTKSRGEAEVLVGLGWHIDNEWQPAFYSSGSTNLYVEYNPNAESGAHNYTTNDAEHNSLLSIGWKYGAVAWQVMAPGTNYKSKVQVDCNVTGVGGKEEAIAGSYRWLYADRTFDPGELSGQTPEVEFSADVTMNGSGSDYETQFAIAGTGPTDGQVGVEIHYQAGSDATYAQGRINVTSINFPAGANAYGQQYYSVNTNAPRISNGQTVRLTVKYFASGYMQSFVNGTLVGQFRTKLNPTTNAVPNASKAYTNGYILHANANTKCTVSNIQVLRKGVDVTNWNPTVEGMGFHDSSYDITNSFCHGIF